MSRNGSSDDRRCPLGERDRFLSQLERIPNNGGTRKEKAYRPDSEGIREWDPKPKSSGVIMLTERVSPSIRHAVGWLYPLEHYDQKLSLDPLSQYTELLLIMGSNEAVDFESVHTILHEARNRLSDQEYERLQGYVDVLMLGRVGIPAEVK